MAYNSAYKGSEIDATVGAVKNKEKTWDDKMPAVTGTAGQMVGFDDSGNPVAQDVPATGLTEEAADRKYLKLTGGTVTGKTAIGATVAGQSGAKILVTDGKVEASGANTVGEATLRVGGVVSASDPPISTFNQTWSDGVERSADLRLGTLNSDAGFVGMTVILKNAAFSICDKTGGATYSVIVNSDGIAASYPDTATFSFSGPVTVGAGTDDTHAATVAQAIPKLTIVTLPASGWDSTTKSQTISVAGVDADETKQWIECTGVISNQSAFDDASIKITAFAENSLTFTASTVPTVDLKVGVKIEAVKDVTPYPNVFGVCWDYSNSSTALSRLTKSNDPNKVVTADITTEPSAAVGTASGSSPFDNYAPWKNMDEYNIVDNAIKYRKGETGFSRTNYDTMVYIPEYWYKIVDDATNSKRYFYIAEKAVDGFEKHPGSGKYVGRYNTISGYASKTGAAPLVNITRASARTGSKGKGDKWSQYDYASWCAVWLLYLVEFADWDSQKKIGRGYVDGNSSAINSGGTDSMVYHTGRASGTDGKTAVQYRHIENPYGNVFEFIDGINFSGGTVYVCLNPASYADDTAANYTNIGSKIQSDGYITAIGVAAAMPWAFFPTGVRGSETTYISDYAYYNSGWRVLRVGGGWSNRGYAGLFYFDASTTSSSTSSNVGARLLFHP